MYSHLHTTRRVSTYKLRVCLYDPLQRHNSPFVFQRSVPQRELIIFIPKIHGSTSSKLCSLTFLANLIFTTLYSAFLNLQFPVYNLSRPSTLTTPSHFFLQTMHPNLLLSAPLREESHRPFLWGRSNDYRRRSAGGIAPYVNANDACYVMFYIAFGSVFGFCGVGIVARV